MTDQKPTRTEQEPRRTGEENTIRDDLKNVDEAVNNKIKDQPKGDRGEGRRSRFIDLHGDEDNNPETTEATYGKQQ